MHHSFVVNNAEPLIGSDLDYDVIEFRPAEPLPDRLNNLQGFFEFVFQQEDVLQIDLLLDDVGDLVFNEEVLAVKLKDFAKYLEPTITFLNFRYQFRWIK